MAAPSSSGSLQQGKAPFELKSASLPVVALLLKTTDTYAIRQALAERFADEPDFFDNDPVILDLSAIQDEAQTLDFDGLIGTLRGLKTIPVAVRNGSVQQVADAREAGLAVAPDAAPTRQADTSPKVEIREVIREVEVVREAPASETVLVEKPLRSGQQVYARGADLIVLAAVNFGAEVIADGHVHVYAPLRGRAIAGARGNTQARIFTQCMEAQLVSVAGIYRTAENDLPAEVASRPAQVRLDGERLVIEPLNKS
ncbi:septum site-determining protein MinC [Lampropedia puyangensis]|uniref:Probable septum site-determining protein MinC n=1 Tax=Lampropedia puyangensis TaxID=1330072 RepID=A0A4S8FCW6_9BURK|nr:septum site-determining protein MinC [Lampropedia puyangensis]THU05149.1 septum site-determining protein MinC [Lampropedia puyangensis]